MLSHGRVLGMPRTREVEHTCRAQQVRRTQILGDNTKYKVITGNKQNMEYIRTGKIHKKLFCSRFLGESLNILPPREVSEASLNSLTSL